MNLNGPEEQAASENFFESAESAREPAKMDRKMKNVV